MLDDRQTIEIVSEENDFDSRKLSEVVDSSSNITVYSSIILSVTILGLLLGIAGVIALIRFKMVAESEDETGTK